MRRGDTLGDGDGIPRNTLTDRRQKALTDDPAGDVAQSNAGTEAAIAASLAEQERLGVPPQMRYAMPKSPAWSDGARDLGVDPAKTDIGAALDRTAQLRAVLAARLGAENLKAWAEVAARDIESGLGDTLAPSAPRCATRAPDQVRAR